MFHFLHVVRFLLPLSFCLCRKNGPAARNLSESSERIIMEPRTLARVPLYKPSRATSGFLASRVLTSPGRTSWLRPDRCGPPWCPHRRRNTLDEHRGFHGGRTGSASQTELDGKQNLWFGSVMYPVYPPTLLAVTRSVLG